MYPVRVGTIALLAAAVGALCSADQALASGGADIASAPTVTFSQQEFGNTATDYGTRNLGDCETGDSWWTLPVTAGDRVTINYEGGVDYQNAWRVGTNDFNVNNAQTYQQSTIGTNDKREASFSVPRTGNMPLEFWNSPGGFCFGSSYNQPGPYDFTAYVVHELRLSLSLRRKTHHHADLMVGVHNPDGVALTSPSFSLGMQVTGTHTFAPIRFVQRSGLLVAHVGWRRSLWGKRVRARVRVSAPGYSTVTSSSVVVRA